VVFGVQVPDGRGGIGHEYDSGQLVGQQSELASHGIAAGRRRRRLPVLLTGPPFVPRGLVQPDRRAEVPQRR